jgi:hypothetical protein
MMKCLRGVSIALIGLLTVVACCLAAGGARAGASPASPLQFQPASADSARPAPPTPTPPPAPVPPPEQPAGQPQVKLASPDSVAPPPASAPAPVAAKPAAHEPANSARICGGPGMASLGGGLGLATLLADGDYTNSRAFDSNGNPIWGDRDVSMRMAFAANLRYTWSKHFRWQVSPGFLWVGYSNKALMPFKTAYFPSDSSKGDVLTLVLPVNFQIQLLQRGRTWMFHEGAGPGVYRVWVEQKRHIVEDPTTHKLHAGFYPGLTAEFGAEHFMKALTNVSMEFSAASHLIFAQRDEQFPNGWNSNLWSLEVRFGANYYFDPTPPKKSSGAVTP